MRILVTGGAGFIGSHIVDALVGSGHEVSVVDDLSTGRTENINPGARFRQVDIRAHGLGEVFDKERPEIVIHDAARANVRESLQNPLLYAEVNVVGSLNILECCRKYRVRKVIYASTGGAVYGEPKTLPVPEEHAVNPLDPYGASKHHVEHYLHLYRTNFGIDFTVLRYPNVYGPRQDPFGEAGVVAIFSRQMLHGENPVVNGTGEQERDFVFVSDVVAANLQSLVHGTGAIYNIGSGRGTSVNRIFELLAGLTGYSGEKQHASPKQGEVFRIFLDAGRANAELHWKPEVPLEDGLRLTVDYFKDHVN